jgi:hypothetical protein
VDNGNDKPNETVVDILAFVVVTQEQWVVVLMAKQPADDSVVAVAAADKAADMVVEVVMEMVELVQLLQHLLVIKAMVVVQCQPTLQVVLVDVGPNLDLEDRNDAADHGAHIVEQPNMMARLVSFTKPIEQGEMRGNDNKGSNMVQRQIHSPRLDGKL